MGVLVVVLMGAAGAVTSQAGPPDWTQWGGPRRNFKCKVTGLAESWPESGPKKLWSRELGDGYSAIVCDGDTLYTQYTIREKLERNKYALEGQEAVIALDARTGKTLWEYKYDVPWEKDMAMEYGPGPYSTPLVSGDRLITIGVTAKMFCFDKSTGKVLWQHDLRKEYDLPMEKGDRGYGSSPCAYRNTVVLPVGGKGKGLVAWDIQTGSEAWKGGNFKPTYASVFVIQLDGEEQFVVFSPKEVLGARPGTGEILWKHAHPTQWGANISTPVWDAKNKRLFISSAYGMGSRGIQLDRKDGRTQATELWYNKRMKIHFGNAVQVGGLVLGSSGDFAVCLLCAVDLASGELAWQQRGIAKATVLYADKKLLVLDEDGNLIVGRVTRDGFDQVAKAQVCDKNAWTVPTLVGRTLFLRDRKSIMALDLGAESSS
jgi:outer membrane protein assembly factor BamB